MFQQQATVRQSALRWMAVLAIACLALPGCRTIEGFGADLRALGGGSEPADRPQEPVVDDDRGPLENAETDGGEAIAKDDAGSAGEQNDGATAAQAGEAAPAEAVAEARPRARIVPRARSDIRRDEPLRGIWVTRWDYRTRDDVRAIMRNIDQEGFTDVFWQVRGQADAYYDSDLEPWGELLFRASNDDTTRPSAQRARLGPGFDPLEIAVREAHRRGLRLHAWMNVMPLWKGTEAPVDPSHPLASHTSWRLKDDTGAEQPLNENYVIVNPVLDAVQDHIAGVARDIASRYEIDGLHLDYVRFVSESLEKGRWYPGDAVSRALYREAHGLPDGAGIEPEAMRRWVRERITGLVGRIAGEARAARPGIMISAAVWRRPDLAREQQLQDAPRWARLGTVDAVIPMMYSEKDSVYRSDLTAWTTEVTRRGSVIPGIGLYKHDSGRQTVGQVNMHAEDERFVLFAYSSIFRSAAPGSLDTPDADSERLRRRVPLRTILRD